MKKKPTIRDVAKHAGVSHATVSYVLNNVKKVSDETKEKVLEAVKELNYYPDFTAISLSKSKSNLIGVMVPLIEDSPTSMFKNNQYYHEFISGVEVVARKNNFDTMITGVGDPEDCRNWVKKRNLDGLIFLGLFPEGLNNEMNKLNIPIVLIDTYEEYNNHFNYVQIDDKLGGYLAAKHLIELGHKKIAFVATNIQASPVDRNRLEGFLKALNEEGVTFNNEHLFESNDISFECGFNIGEKILTKKKDITGIVTVSDNLAIGIIKALQDNGQHIPNDYSIVGFDDLSISQFITPSLTTIRQDIFAKGKIAAELLVKSIDESQDETSNKVELPVKLIVRDSTNVLKES